VGLFSKYIRLKIPFALIYDFIGLDAMTRNPAEGLGTYFWNCIWSQAHRVIGRHKNLAIFIGEPEDIPDKTFGFLLANRRRHARKYYQFAGYILSFAPEEYTDKVETRKKLGYGEEPLVLCSIGGTAVGKALLELCGEAYPIIKTHIPEIRMVLVCGPRLKASSLNLPPGLETKQYVPNLYEHFAASDLAIVQAGGTTTLELTALRVPFIYFPLEGHSEQEIMVSGRLRRHEAGLRMSHTECTPSKLSAAIMENISRQVTYKKIPVDGASKAAGMIAQILSI
jgi:UDP-N-acetylglucosamine:LPS N-acetylglucosamine transferase